MAEFTWPDWKPFAAPSPTPPPDPPPSNPAAAREEKIANDTRVESELNRFMAAKQDALFNAPDAFYRTQGADAIHAAPVVTDRLGQLEDELTGGLANDCQRQRLGSALDAQMALARDGMARHVAEQSLVWQRQTAQDRIALLTREAALHHNDTELVDTLGHAAATAARAHARVGEGPPGGDAEDAAAATARSGVLGAAIQARLDKGDTEGANALFTRVKDQLDPEHAAPLQAQLDTVQRLDAAKDHAYRLVPVWSGASYEENDAQHAEATQKNQTDNAGDPEHRAGVQHVLDVRHGLRRSGLDRAAAQRDQAVQDWLTRGGPEGQPRTERPPAALWNTLGPEDRAAVDRQLNANAHDSPVVVGPSNSDEVMSDAALEPAEPGQQYARADNPEDDPVYGLKKIGHLPPTQTERDKHHIGTREITPPPPIGIPGLGARGGATAAPKAGAANKMPGDAGKAPATGGGAPAPSGGSASPTESSSPKPESAPPRIRLPENDAHLKHIFRDQENHLPDTPENRQTITDVANDKNNFMGEDSHGSSWFGKSLPDGRQVWVQVVKGGTIRNGGINTNPKSFDPKTGLSAPQKP